MPDQLPVCGHSHCGGLRALCDEVHPQARNLAPWLDLGRHAVLPVQVTPEAPRRTDQRAVVLQLERLMACTVVREQVDAGRIGLHGRLCVIEDGEAQVFDAKSGVFVAASSASHGRPGPCQPIEGAIDSPVFNVIGESYAQRATARSAESTAI